MKHCGNFKKDLALSNFYQAKVNNFYEYDSIEHKKGYFKDYDAILTCHNDDGNIYTITMEVKVDTYAIRTRKIAIEFEYKQQASGIAHTKADYWLHFIHGSNEFFDIPTYKLRQLIKSNKYEVKDGGDYNASKMYLVPFEHIEEYLYEYT